MTTRIMRHLKIAADEMFWCDGELGRIEKASLDGKSRELLYAHEDHYFGLTIDDEYVYVTGRTIRQVLNG